MTRSTTPRRRSLLLVVALLVVVAVAAGLAWAALGRDAPGGEAVLPLPERLRDAVSVDAVLEDMAALQRIADDHGGVRAAGTPGYMASAALVAGELRAAGLEVTIDTFDVPLFSEVGDNRVAMGELTYASGVDFRPMIFSPSGELTARLVPVRFDPEHGPTAVVTGNGCGEDDFADVPAGVVILVHGGGCAARDIVDHAVAAEAIGLVVSYPAWEENAVRRPTLRTPDVPIPVLGTTARMGVELAAAAADGTDITLAVRTAIVDRPAVNVVAETPGGDAEHVVMLGGHLDAVIDGPGINDNGSGTMAVLEIARRIAAMQPERKVRVGFWTGEEIGLYGSFRYLSTLAFEERRAIDLYLNFDMLGSPNGGRIVYDDELAATGSAGITAQFVAALEADGLAYLREDLGGGSDHFPFQQGGVPTGGLFSGASEPKDEEAAALFGGEVGAPYDACYHLTCDRVDGVNRQLLEEMLRTAAYVTGVYASASATARP